MAHFFTLEPNGRGAERFIASITPEAISDYINDPSFYYVAAFQGEDLAGVAALRDGRHLFHLFVAPVFQRQGLARQLWATVMAKMATNPEGITVNSTLYAVPVYERFGFVATGPRVEMNGIAFVPMRARPMPEG